MANYKGHIAGGLGAGIATIASLDVLNLDNLPSQQTVTSDWQLSVGLITISVLFALWPDVDTNSKAQNIFYGVAFGVNILLIVSGLFVFSALLGLLAMTPIVGKHRGWTHSKLAAFLVPAPIVFIPLLSSQDISKVGLLMYVASVAGYLSHLLLDGLIWKRIKVRSSWR